MKQRTLYQVRVTQEIPFCDYDEDGEETQVTNTLTYTADEGTNYLSVSVYYRISYLGV